MMHRPLFSIIIPVYNAESTLKTAAESILNQSFTDLELLLVDDGSQDDSLSVCRQIAQKDSRVRVISQKNGGICCARNHGLAQACGRYVGFCDDDDEYLPQALERVAELIQHKDVDLVRGGYILMRENSSGKMVTLPHDRGEGCRLSSNRNGKAYLSFLHNTGPQFVWNAFYRGELLEKIRFDEQCRYGLEDFIFNAAVYASDVRAVYLPDPVYRHYERFDSTSAATLQAVIRRVQTVPAWIRAEYAAAVCRSTDAELPLVWAQRKAEIITFLMHQLRDSHAPRPVCRKAWKAMRSAMREIVPKNGTLDFLRVAGHNKKQAVALLLYATHMQGMYVHLPNKEEQLLK